MNEGQNTFEDMQKDQLEVSQSMLSKLGITDNDKRAAFLTQKTPKSVIKRRRGRGGTEFDYIEGWYVKAVLNSVFCFQWDFELMPVKEGEMFYMTAKQVIVFGKLVIRDKDGIARITKMGMGKKDIAYPAKKPGDTAPTNVPMDLGNDIKAAETDALKRCATGLGIGLDLYAKSPNN